MKKLLVVLIFACILAISGCITGQTISKESKNYREVQEEYTEQEPYTVEIPYEVQVPYEHQLTYIYSAVDEDEKWNIELGFYRVFSSNVKNTDSEDGGFTLKCQIISLKKGTKYVEGKDYVYAGKSETIQCTYDSDFGEDIAYKCEIIPQTVTRYRTETRYITETRYRTVTKYRTEAVCD